MTLLFCFVLLGASLLFVSALTMRRRPAQDSKFSGAPRVIASLAVMAAVAPGVWLLASPIYGDGRGLLARSDALLQRE